MSSCKDYKKNETLNHYLEDIAEVDSKLKDEIDKNKKYLKAEIDQNRDDLNVVTESLLNAISGIGGNAFSENDIFATPNHAIIGSASTTTQVLGTLTDSNGDTYTTSAATTTFSPDTSYTIKNTPNDLSIVLTDDAGTASNEKITLTNTNGTDNAAIDLTATAGGITMKVADEKELTLGNAGGDAYFKVAASATAGNEDLRIVNTNGTDAAAIALTATAGGVDIDAAATKDVNIAGGQIALVSKDAAASAISLTTNQGTNETIVVTNSQGTAAGAIALTATAGGINLSTASGTGGILKLNPGTGGLITKRAVQDIDDSAIDPTAAQLVAGFISVTGGGAGGFQLPTGTALANAMPNNTVIVGDSFICYVVNASGGLITYSAGASGSTLTGTSGSNLTQKNNSLAKIDFIFTVASDGSEEYHALLIADND